MESFASVGSALTKVWFGRFLKRPTPMAKNGDRRLSDHGSVITNQHHAQQTSEEILKLVEAVRTGQSLEEQ